MMIAYAQNRFFRSQSDKHERFSTVAVRRIHNYVATPQRSSRVYGTLFSWNWKMPSNSSAQERHQIQTLNFAQHSIRRDSSRASYTNTYKYQRRETPPQSIVLGIERHTLC
jgi:hypothetical protein